MITAPVVCSVLPREVFLGRRTSGGLSPRQIFNGLTVCVCLLQRPDVGGGPLHRQIFTPPTACTSRSARALSDFLRPPAASESHARRCEAGSGRLTASTLPMAADTANRSDLGRGLGKRPTRAYNYPPPSPTLDSLPPSERSSRANGRPVVQHFMPPTASGAGLLRRREPGLKAGSLPHLLLGTESA